MSRWDVQKYAREAYDMGIRYIGACCGFEPYHVRAIAEEVQETSLNAISVLYVRQCTTLESYVTECVHSKLNTEAGIKNS